MNDLRNTRGCLMCPFIEKICRWCENATEEEQKAILANTESADKLRETYVHHIEIEREMYVHPIEIEEGPLSTNNIGTSTDVLINGQNNQEVQQELTLEKLFAYTKALQVGDYSSVKPFVIGFRNNKMVCQELTEGPDGNYVLPELKVVTKEEIELKSKIVRMILRKIDPVLKAEIHNVTYIALIRKDKERLLSMFNSLSSGTKPRLENRPGCIFLIVGNDEFLL